MKKPDSINTLSEDTFDPRELSLKYLVSVLFFKSASVNYKQAVALAGSASFFKQVSVEGKEVNLAGFDNTQSDLSRLSVLIDIIRIWKGAMFFAAGRPLPITIDLKGAVDCYLQSLACNDYKAYCHEVIHCDFFESNKTDISMKLTMDDFFKEEEPRSPLLLSPCRRISGYIMRLSKYHPSSLTDQIQALGIEREVNWCPHFRPEMVREI